MDHHSHFVILAHHILILSHQGFNLDFQILDPLQPLLLDDRSVDINGNFMWDLHWDFYYFLYFNRPVHIYNLVYVHRFLHNCWHFDGSYRLFRHLDFFDDLIGYFLLYFDILGNRYNLLNNPLRTLNILRDLNNNFNRFLNNYLFNNLPRRPMIPTLIFLPKLSFKHV